METIGIRVHRAVERSDKCFALVFKCDQDDCPLRKKGQCINAKTYDKCIYGGISRVNGWTPRAKKYSSFLEEWRDKAKNKPIKTPDKDRITFIGEYVWLPYSHMNHSDGERLGIEFESYSHAFNVLGSMPFMKQEHFTPETIVKLVEFKPKALFGGIISKYPDEIVPKFLNDLKDVAPDLYESACDIKPGIEEIAAKAIQQPIRLGWLVENEFRGKAKINGKECFIYSTGSIRFELSEDEWEGKAAFPNPVGTIEVRVQLPDETPVYPDPTSYKYMGLLNRAREARAVIESNQE